MNLQIGKAIYTILSENEELTEKIANKVFPLVADNGTTFPFIVYKRLSVMPATSKDKYIYQEVAQFEVVVATDNYNDSIDIGELVCKTLQGKKGVFNGINIQNIEVDDSNEDFIEDTFIQNITIKIYINNG